jgi:hypothetical protein
MNKRIKELADEAGLRFTQLMSNPMVPVVDGRETDLEKFAELIVRECVEVINDASVKALRQNTFMGDDVPSCIHESNIMKHFGVEQ